MHRKFQIVSYVATLILCFGSYAFAGNVAPNKEYLEDELGFVGNPLKQELDAEPSTSNSPDRYEETIKPIPVKAIRIGTVTLKKQRLYFIPLVQNPMAFEWWTLTGRTETLGKVLDESAPKYCKLKGAQEMTKVIHRKSEAAVMGYRDVYYTFKIDEVVWVKSKEEILEIQGKINRLIQEGDAYYEEKRWEKALPLFNRAKSLAQEYLPNAVSYNMLEKASECEHYVKGNK